MPSDFAFAPPPRRQRASSPDFQLRSLAIFWRAFFVALIVREYAVWRYVSKFVPADEPLVRILGFIKHSPKSFHVAFLVGVGVTLGVWLGFRLFALPLMRRWYHPTSLDPTYSNPFPFHVLPGEEPLAEHPARRLDGLTRHPGMLIRTNQRILFFPYSWEQEPWSVSLGQLASARTEPTVRRVLGLVRGYPDHVSLTDESGATFRLIVADPDRVLDALRA